MNIGKRIAAWAPLLALALGSAGLTAMAQEHRQFTDHDRQSVHAWQDKHRDHPPVGFRAQDRLPPAMESRLRVGVVLGPDLRERIHPIPHDLLVTLAPPPPHYRYVVIGDHVCLIDAGFHVSDVLHLELNF